MITLHMASMPEREKMLEIALRSLLPQVDKVNIMLWRYDVGAYPAFLNHSKVRIFHHDNKLEDGSRFLFIDHIQDDYALVCDDDIEYPADFVRYLIDKHALYGGIVGVMGKIMRPRPIQSYYRDTAAKYRTFADVPEDVVVDVLGACGILWHTSEVRLSAEDMKIPNSDICIAAYAKRHGTTLTCCAHKADYLKNLMPMAPDAPSIFGKYAHNDKVLTDFVNENL